MSDSLASFAAIFRAVLILHGVEPPVTKHEIVALTVDHLKLDGVPFEKIFNIREDNFAKTLDDTSANQLFADYLEQIEKVIEAVDKVFKS
jgi:DNA polymerase III delta subunit